MSVYIHGMKAPESCHECRMLEGDTMDGLCHAAGKWLDDESFAWFQFAEGDFDMSKPLNCPLIDVTGHGRLIDADELDRKIYNEYPVKVFGSVQRMARMREIIAGEKTVIPANKEGLL